MRSATPKRTTTKKTSSDNNTSNKKNNPKRGASASVGRSDNKKPAHFSKKQPKNAISSSRSHKTPTKKGLHPRNPHRNNYDFEALAKRCPDLKPYIETNAFGDLSVNFSDPNAVKMLNKALLHEFYGVEHWDIPEGYLCPPIPGRADYLHYIADLLAESHQEEIPRGKKVRGLDVGTGANCVYPIIGTSVYGWHFQATDIDPVSVKGAKLIAENNKKLKGMIDCRLQKHAENIFLGAITQNQRLDFTMCNPPFHSSLAEATAGSARKVKNLSANAMKKGTMKHIVPKHASVKHGQKPILNFGGQKAELWCVGGEAAFLKRMIDQSKVFAEQCLWFTSLISKKENLPMAKTNLKNQGVEDIRVIDMVQGQKITRILAWTYITANERSVWFK